MVAGQLKERDKEWVGRILFARRRIEHLNRAYNSVNLGSVLLIIDDILPREASREKKQEVKRK